ncbi:LytTR family DNA-binding domain-containing protein [Dyadobacter sp. CY323]|uniref:LytR/AlgR family response regulator transcription factor n=1 Tax=Dyadobacter sp. CY323 TaxID=2907302 RepID=UPI001F3AD2CD|nr:LytTR family DNA-binding domain-containing protein [Dyadobacter sp. CY323]MCE6987987.1 LytTR family DNA-binding domain-containing protein [Dyadobacter sp. CY323]
MNVLIIEDEALSATRLQNLINRYDPEINILAKIPSVRESVQWLGNENHVKPDLIFLDLHLEDDLGFRIIDELKLTIPIIFTTAYSEYTLRAFKANSVDYLLKPIDQNELVSSLDKFKSLEMKRSSAPDLAAFISSYLTSAGQDTFKERFLATAGTKMFSIKTVDIAYFIIEQKATFLRTFDGKHLAMEYSLDKVFQLLDPKLFFRVNRSLIISLNSIQVINSLSAGRLKLELAPSTAQDVYVSADRIANFKQWLGK